MTGARSGPTSRHSRRMGWRPHRPASALARPLAISLALVVATSLAMALAPERAMAGSPADAPAGPAEDVRLEPIALEDQHGVLRRVDASTRVVLFSRDMDGGRLLEQALADLPDGALEARGAVYVSDISGMPALVARLFALPSLRRRPYPMLLDRDGEATRALPDEEGRATLVFLDALRITRVEHADSAERVRALLDPEGSNEPR